MSAHYKPGQKVRRRLLDRDPSEGQVGEVLDSRPCATGTQYLVQWVIVSRWWVHEDVLEEINCHT